MKYLNFQTGHIQYVVILVHSIWLSNLRMTEHVTVFARSPQLKVTETIVIKDFLKELELFCPGEKFSSKTFILGNTPLEIEIYPNGRWGDDGGTMDIYLCNKSNEDVRVQFEAVADIFQPGIFTELNLEADNGFPVGRNVSHAECIETYQDKKDFVLTVNVEIPGEDLEIVEESERVILCKKFGVWKKVYKKMQRTDFTLVFGGVELGCHKHVLAAASSVFEAMVENCQLKEAIESRAKIEISEEVGRAFLRFMYTGELEERLLKEQALGLLELGDKYDVQELKQLAEEELVKQLDKWNMRKMISIGETFNAKVILKAALKMKKANRVWLWSQVSDVFKFRYELFAFKWERILLQNMTYRRAQWNDR